MEEKINLIARLLLVGRKIENLQGRIEQYHFNSSRKVGETFDERYSEMEKLWIKLSTERFEIEEALSVLMDAD